MRMIRDIGILAFFILFCMTSGLSSDSRWCEKVSKRWKVRTVEVQSHRWPYRKISQPESYLADEVISVCCQGYAGPKCDPICSKPCVPNSVCVAPNKCECQKAYMLSDDGNSCVSKCSKCPPFTMCVNDQCVCDIGYTTDDTKSKCIPVCETPCAENEFCSQPNQCSCLNRYERNNGTGLCQPICVVGCPPNNICTAPNTCSCSENYILNSTTSVCDPICDSGCPENSECKEPNNCVCNQGFVPHLNRNGEFSCIVPCPKNCEPYGQCFKANECSCYQGYEISDNNEQMCVPTCSSNCLNGYCYAPELCHCNSGYLMGPNNTCQPVCHETCENGFCSAPDVCSCLEGFEMVPNTTICKPICETECLNGFCVAPNFCICLENYQPQETNSNICIPTCDNCESGTCVEPNVCLIPSTTSSDPPTSSDMPEEVKPSTQTKDTTATVDEQPDPPIMEYTYKISTENCDECTCWVIDSDEAGKDCVPTCYDSDDCSGSFDCACSESKNIMYCNQPGNHLYSVALHCDQNWNTSTPSFPVGIITSHVIVAKETETPYLLIGLLVACLVLVIIVTSIFIWVRRKNRQSSGSFVVNFEERCPRPDHKA